MHAIYVILTGTFTPYNFWPVLDVSMTPDWCIHARYSMTSVVCTHLQEQNVLHDPQISPPASAPVLHQWRSDRLSPADGQSFPCSARGTPPARGGGGYRVKKGAGERGKRGRIRDTKQGNICCSILGCILRVETGFDWDKLDNRV